MYKVYEPLKQAKSRVYGDTGMYGSMDDPVVRYYDRTFALSSPKEIEWYVRNVRIHGSPVLDLACGTGRLAIEFAKNGIETDSIDNSGGMLSLFEVKLNKESINVQRSIRIMKQPMQSFNTDRKYLSIVCCDAFFHNLTIDDQKSCLRSVHAHLADNGYFLFNIHNNPNPDFLHWVSSTDAAAYKERGTYTLEDGGCVYIEQAMFHDVSEQTIETKLHFIARDKGGKVTEDVHSEWKSRYLCKYEMIHLLELTGFKISSIAGDYGNGPITNGSQLIFTCTKA